jgi:hypothetical protein
MTIAINAAPPFETMLQEIITHLVEEYKPSNILRQGRTLYAHS